MRGPQCNTVLIILTTREIFETLSSFRTNKARLKIFLNLDCSRVRCKKTIFEPSHPFFRTTLCLLLISLLQGESNINTFSCRKSNLVVRYNFWNRVASKKCFLSPFLWVCGVWMSRRQVWEPSPAKAFVPNWEAQEDVTIQVLFHTGSGSLKINFLFHSSSSSAVFMV